MTTQTGPAAPERRPYDSPVRRERTARTRERILEAATELGRGLRSWDWAGVTVAAVAERAGVAERTVFRHFGGEAELRQETAARLEAEAGVLAAPVALAALPDLLRRLYAFLEQVPGVTTPGRADPALAAVDARRREALLASVAAGAPGLPDTAARRAAAVLDVLAGPGAYRRLAVAWELDGAAASAAAGWVAGLVVDALERGEGPPAG